jgi:hypothetical protein
MIRQRITIYKQINLLALILIKNACFNLEKTVHTKKGLHHSLFMHSNYYYYYYYYYY